MDLRQLMKAILYNNNLSLVQILIERGAEINSNDKYGHSALFHAVAKRNLLLVSKLIAYGAQIDDAMSEKIKELQQLQNLDLKELTLDVIDAIEKGDLSYIKNAIANGLSINSVRQKPCNNTLLMEAIMSDNIEIVQWLINNGADINACNDYGNTPLLFAIAVPDLKQVRNTRAIAMKLIRYNANVNVCSKRGKTPLILAAYLGFDDIVEYLITKGANVNACDDAGNTALMINIIHQPTLSIMQELISNGANINVCNKEGMTVLCWAIDNYLQTALYLIENGADMSALYDGKMTIFQYIIQNNREIYHEFLKCVLLINNSLSEKTINEAMRFAKKIDNHIAIDLLLNYKERHILETI